MLFFGISVVIQNITALAFSANNRGYSYLDNILAVGELQIEANRAVELAVAATACIACALFFRFTRAGMAMHAVIQQSDAAQLVGIDVDRINIQVFALGFSLAALAGALVSMTQSISPFAGFPFTIRLFVVIILGGLGNLMGSMIAAIILAAVEVYGTAILFPSFRSILIYGVFIAVLFDSSARPAWPISCGTMMRPNWIGFVLVALGVTIVAALPLALGPYSLSVALGVLMWIALAESWAMFSGLSGYVSLGHAVFFGIGAYVTVLLWNVLSLWISVPLGEIPSALFALCLRAGPALGYAGLILLSSRWVFPNL